MPRPYPREFRDDVVRVARNRDDGVTIEQIATDFGVHPMTLTKWMRQADIDEGTKPARSTGESEELAELRRRNRLLEQENEVLRRARGLPVAGQSAGKRTLLWVQRGAGSPRGPVLPDCGLGRPVRPRT